MDNNPQTTDVVTPVIEPTELRELTCPEIDARLKDMRNSLWQDYGDLPLNETVTVPLGRRYAEVTRIELDRIRLYTDHTDLYEYYPRDGQEDAEDTSATPATEPSQPPGPDPELLRQLYAAGTAEDNLHGQHVTIDGTSWYVHRVFEYADIVEVRTSPSEHSRRFLGGTYEFSRWPSSEYIGLNSSGQPVLVENPHDVRMRELRKVEEARREAEQTAWAAAPTVYLDADDDEFGRALWAEAIAVLNLDGTEVCSQAAVITGQPVNLRRCAFGVLADTASEPFAHYRVKPPDSFLAKSHDKRYSDPDKTIAAVWEAFAANQNAPRLCGTMATQLKEKVVEWLWEARLPKGMLAVMDGDPGNGKSFLTLDLAARLTSGKPLYADGRTREPMHCILINYEDAHEEAILPRFLACGGNPARLRLLDEVEIPRVEAKPRGRPRKTSYQSEDEEPEEPVIPKLEKAHFQLPRDIELLRRHIVADGAGLVIIDPLMSALAGKVDSHKDQDIRSQVMAPLKAVAEETGCTILLVRHLTKGSEGANVIYRGGGSIGIIGAVRVGLAVMKDVDDENIRILVVTKNNLAPLATSLKFTIMEDAASHKPRVEWLGTSAYTAQSLSDTHTQRGREQSRLGDLSQDILEVMKPFTVFPASPARVCDLLHNRAVDHAKREKASDGVIKAIKAPEYGAVQRTMCRLAEKGLLEKYSFGQYVIARAKDEPMPVRD